MAAHSLVKTMPCRRRRSPQSVPSPPPRSIPICTTRQRFTVIPLLTPHTHTHIAQRTTSVPNASEGGTDGRMDFALLLLGPPASRSRPWRPSPRLPSPLLSSRSGGQMDHLRASFAYHHRCIPQLLKGQRHLLGAIILAVSCGRKVIPTGAAAAALFYLSLTSRYKASRFPAMSSLSLHRGHNDLVSDHRSRQFEENYIPS